MKQLHRKHYWLGRLLASDPGYIRLHKAARATVSLMVSIFTTLFILHTTGKPLLTPAIVSGMIGMMGIMVVVDETKKEMKVTTLWLGVSAMIGVTLGSLFANHAYYIDVLLVLIVFSTFYFTRFGVRYFSLFMIGFMTVYFSSVLKLSSVSASMVLYGNCNWNFLRICAEFHPVPKYCQKSKKKYSFLPYSEQSYA